MIPPHTVTIDTIDDGENRLTRRSNESSSSSTTPITTDDTITTRKRLTLCLPPTISEITTQEECAQSTMLRLRVMYHQGFGFPVYEPGYLLLISIVTSTEDAGSVISTCAKTLGLTTVLLNQDAKRWSIYLGHSEYGAHELLITELLQLPFTSFYLHCNAGHYRPILMTPSTIYTNEVRDELLIREARVSIKLADVVRSPITYAMAEYPREGAALREPANWRGVIGRQFCIELNKSLEEEAIEKPDFQAHYLQWSLFRNFDEDTLAILPDRDVVPTPPSKRVKQVCMFCLDRVADTRAIPCGCMVVCTVCSDELHTSKFRDKCLNCQGPLEAVYSSSAESC